MDRTDGAYGGRFGRYAGFVAMAQSAHRYFGEADSGTFPEESRATRADGLKGLDTQDVLTGSQPDGAAGEAHRVHRRTAYLAERRAGLRNNLPIDRQPGAVPG